MISRDDSIEAETSVIKNCTTASTLIKPNSLKFELLFGDYYRKIETNTDDSEISQACDYYFLPGQIFGFTCESFGKDFKKFHYGFVLRACEPNEIGCVIPGINPGAEILAKTLNSVATDRLRKILRQFADNIDLLELSTEKYRYLNHLLETKSNTDFFVGELIEQHDNC